jgi:hypothetical protein
METDRRSVSNSLVSFDPILDRIRDQEFVPRLPSCFRVIDNPDDGFKRGAEQDPLDTRTPKKGKAKAVVVKNESPVEGWGLKDGEKWELFSGENSRDRPKWDKDSRVCHKYHVKGYCFGDCKDRASHVPREKIPSKIKGEFDAWRRNRSQA